MSPRVLIIVWSLVTVAIVGTIVVARRRTRRSMTLSERWLHAQEQRDTRAGVDLPRWRLPAEREELARQERLAAIHEVAARAWHAKGA